ncbi:hypothetical protein GW17_00011566 [Ensete ventricosum]|nr:hypothetical protein GW17_00011566 [Ensete ventricosum]
MWKLKQFMPKEPNSLEGRMVEVGNIKLQVRNVIAEGGFSCVYLARDAVNASNQYALKHMICQDEESLDLAMKEISVMKMLKGHPNVVVLIAHTILDMGRVKEVLLVMEFCEKSLVAVLENRGAGYFEEKQILLIFRDVCNAVFAMHCQSPPIAHRSSWSASVGGGSGGPLGAFWSTQYAQDSRMSEDKRPVFDEEPINLSKPKHNPTNHSREHQARTPPRHSVKSPEVVSSEDFEIRFSPNGSEYGPEKTKVPNHQTKGIYQDQAFNTFVAEFDTSKLNSGNAVSSASGKHRSVEKELEEEFSRLKQELKQVNLEKEEMTSKCEKLSAICRSQRQEIQELKCAVAAASPSPPNKESKPQFSPGSSQEKIEGNLPEIQRGLFPNNPSTPSPDPKPWSAFGDTKVQDTPKSSHPKSVRTIRGTSSNRNNIKLPSASSADEPWGFDQDSFRADSHSSQAPKPSFEGNTSQRFGGAFGGGGGTGQVKAVETNRPSGWTGF